MLLESKQPILERRAEICRVVQLEGPPCQKHNCAHVAQSQARRAGWLFRWHMQERPLTRSCCPPQLSPTSLQACLALGPLSRAGFPLQLLPATRSVRGQQVGISSLGCMPQLHDACKAEQQQIKGVPLPTPVLPKGQKGCTVSRSPPTARTIGTVPYAMA